MFVPLQRICISFRLSMVSSQYLTVLPNKLNLQTINCADGKGSRKRCEYFLKQLYVWSFYLLCLFQGFKVGYIVFQNSTSITAAKSHPHDAPLVVCTEQHPVKTGVESG